MNTNGTICGLYTRVSSRNQADADYSSLETQRERLEAYCRSQENYTIYRVYEDGGYSADSLDRPALKEMLRDIREGKLNCVLAYKIDRLTRSVKDFHLLMDLFERCGVKFVSVTQSLDTQNPMGRLLRNVLLDFAQFEREMTADRTRDKMYQRAQKGLWNGGNVPYGYAAENKRLIFDTEEADRLRFIFHHFADAPSLARLRDELHRRGWYTRSGKPWSKMALDHILRNPIYCGLIRFNEDRFKGEHAALIEETLYKKVQSVRRAKTMHFNNSVCQVKHINADHVERMVVQKLSDLSQNEVYLKMSVAELNGDLKRKMEPLGREAGQIKNRLEEIEQEIGRYVKALGRGKLSIGRLEAEISTLEAHKQALQRQYDDLQRKINESAVRDYNAEILQRTLKDFRTVFTALTPPEQSEALQCVLKGVIVYPLKLDLEIFELEEFHPSSQNRKDWLPGLDSN